MRLQQIQYKSKQFYESGRSLKSFKSQEITIVMADLNTKVGNGSMDAVTDLYELGDKYEGGAMLIKFFRDKNLVIKNTYKLRHRRLYKKTLCVVRYFD